MTLGIGSFGINKKADVFLGGDTVDEVMGHARKLFGEAVVDELIAKFVEAVGGDPFDVAKANLEAGGVTSVSDPKAPLCNHGARVYKSGVGKNGGKPWAAWMCPTPQNAPDKCPPEWA